MLCGMKKSLLIIAVILCAAVMSAQDRVIPLYKESDFSELASSKDYMPELEVFLPLKSCGQGVVVCPGGGYKGLSYPTEGLAVAKWLNSNGIAAFVLRYRMPDGRPDVPIGDLTKAFEIVVANALGWNVNPENIGLMGFSAGGHLAATGLVKLTGRLRPAFGILIYPVISMQTGVTHQYSKSNLIGRTPPVELVDKYSAERYVTENTPPTILFHCSDDPVVKPENALLFYQALLNNRVRTEMHIYPEGGHGWGFMDRPYFKYYEEFKNTLLRWLNERGGCDTVKGKARTRVACVGNSITFGAGLVNQARDSYPAVLGQMLGSAYEVRNFGVSGATALSSGNIPYINTSQYARALDYRPEIVFIKLGTNDSKVGNWKHKDEFRKSLQGIVDAFASLDSKPEIFLCLPATCYVEKGSICDSVVVHEVIPRIREVAETNELTIVDMHSATSNMKEHFPDKLHPDRFASIKLAECAYTAITGKPIDGFELQDFPGVKTKWRGYDKYDFEFNGRAANIVVPANPLPGKPWIWRPAFFGAFPEVDLAMLALGYYVVHYDLAFLYGSPRSQDLGTRFYDAMIKYYDLSKKVILEGFSRGGLFAVNWAAANPEKVSCIYLDAPVCDINSWPGRDRNELWQEFLKEWNLSESDMNGFAGNPIDNLKPLAAAGIPMIVVAGDSDKTVPYEKNGAVLVSRYKKMKGKVEVIIKEGCDHHPHSLPAPAPIVRFLVDNAL